MALDQAQPGADVEEERRAAAFAPLYTDLACLSSATTPRG